MTARSTDRRGASPWRLALGATGIVFGDIGTSPLYAFRESFVGKHKLPLEPFHVLGVLSMLVWTLIVVVTVKYVMVTMRADNRGEGGSFALLALARRVTPKASALRWIGFAALGATALFYGDAVITPAISVLSAVEGLELIQPSFAKAVVPATLVLVVALFAVQRFGTERIGTLFGPVMLVWFLTIGVLGGAQVARNPQVIAAISPLHAIGFVVADPLRAFFTLGTVVLAVTGAEALYADMGHFGRRPIARAWTFLALPALLLCYAGQSALVLADPKAITSPFYLMAPKALLVPLILLATAATIIASQAIISGAFSVTRQAMHLGFLPRVRIVHTSSEERGQVYAPGVNALVFVAVVGLVIGFGSSDRLASAFGLAVTTTMVLTTLMIGYVIFRIWQWPLWWAVPLYVVLLATDLALFAASATKFVDGGWLPAGIAAVLMLVFSTWRRGRDLLVKKMVADTMPVALFAEKTADVHRIPATAVFLTTLRDGVPPALLHNIKANRVLHERTLIVTIETALTPHVGTRDRLTIADAAGGITRVTVRFGFFEHHDVPAALADLPDGIDPAATYFLSRQTLVPTRKPGMARWREHLFAAMVRNAETPMTYFALPIARVVELGSQVEI